MDMVIWGWVLCGTVVILGLGVVWHCGDTGVDCCVALW
jgi:hypothetical protein